MKRLLTAALALSTLLGLYAQEAVPAQPSHEPAFPELTDWSSAIQAAKASGKPIFVDAYTDWCGWCKVMDKKTFSLPAVKSYMNDNMECYRLDMEHNQASHNLRLAYGINAFPTFVILSPTGEFLGKLVGYSDSAEWMNSLAEFLTAEHPERPGFPALSSMTWPSDIQAYADSDFETRPDAEKMGAILASVEQGSFLWMVIAQNFPTVLTPNDLSYLLDEQQWLGTQYGSDIAQDVLKNTMMRRLYSLSKTASEEEFEGAIQDYLVLFPDDAMTALSMNVRFYKEKGLWSKLVDVLAEQTDGNMINSLSWAVYQSCEDANQLERAAEICGSYVASHADAGYAIRDTYAHLLMKLERWDQAEAEGRKAIEWAETSGEDAKETRELLQEIKVKREADLESR
jgi:thiol-disulfide isomerase/thioredoxin